jgi:hypothetical protein
MSRESWNNPLLDLSPLKAWGILAGRPVVAVGSSCDQALALKWLETSRLSRLASSMFTANLTSEDYLGSLLLGLPELKLDWDEATRSVATASILVDPDVAPR